MKRRSFFGGIVAGACVMLGLRPVAEASVKPRSTAIPLGDVLCALVDMRVLCFVAVHPDGWYIGPLGPHIDVRLANGSGMWCYQETFTRHEEIGPWILKTLPPDVARELSARLRKPAEAAIK